MDARKRCNVCSHLCKETLQAEGSPVPFHSDFGSLKNSATKGCALCRLLLFNAEVLRWRIDFVQKVITADSPPLFLRIVNNEFVDITELSCFYTDPQGQEIQVSQADLSTDNSNLVNQDSLTRQQVACHWLSNCSSTHTECNRISLQAKNDSAMPARLIEIRSHDDNIACRLRKCTAPVAYAILSYRWGNSAHAMMTTADNLNQHIDDIPLKYMPKTWRDAIDLAHSLDLGYIWIDAMCIIQPQSPTDSKDWQEQSAIMGQIYSGATVTIAASSALASSEGCFPLRSSLRSIPEQCSLFPGSEEDNPVVLPDFPSWNSYITNSPLQERGWTLQERILSNRIIHCTTYGMFWECAEQKCQEAHADRPYFGTTVKLTNSIANDRHSSVPLRPAKALSSPEKRDLKTLYWHATATDYASRQLGVETDRFPALSAVAREIAILTGDTYVAGLWKLVLLSQLFWRYDVDSGSPEKIKHRKQLEQIRPVQGYIAPSWSWMSLCHRFVSGRGKLTWRMPTGTQSDSANILSIHVIPVFKANPYGPIHDDASLLVRAKMPYFDSQQWTTASSQANKALQQGPSVNFDTEQHENFYALLLRKDYFSNKHSKTSMVPLCRGLALVQSNGARNTYRRVGIFSWSNIDFFDAVSSQEVNLV